MNTLRLVVLSIAISFFHFSSSAQDVSSYKAEDLMTRIKSNPDTFYVVNFWATWCAPCIKELPEFDKLVNACSPKPVKVLLVSLDFPKDYPQKIEKFIRKKDLAHEVVWLNETKANEFIPKIAEEWQGSIPATLLYYGESQYRSFFEGTITAEQLMLLINKQLNRRY